MGRLFRRHQRCCLHRSKGRKYDRCGCFIWAEIRLNGVRFQKSTGTRDEEKAARLLAEWEQTGAFPTDTSEPKKIEIFPSIDGMHTQPRPAAIGTEGEPILLERAWQESIEYRQRVLRRKPATIYKDNLLRRQMEDFGRRRGLRLLNQFTVAELEEFQSEWHEGSLACSKKLDRLKAFFRRAFLRRWIQSNPAAELLSPDPSFRPTLPFTQMEMANILVALERYPDKSGRTGCDNGLRLRAFVLTLRYSGMRIGDVTRLSVHRVQGNKILLYTQKTGVPVFCVLPDFVAQTLSSINRLSSEYYFWTGQSTLHTAIGTWQRSLKNLFELAKITRGYAHRFRDTFCVELLLAGVPIEDVSILLGHSNIRITQKHYSPWVRDRQMQLEASLKKVWTRDPVVLREASSERARNKPQLIN